jgi:predicted PhzF superfamily epimerase YddE/YHI9
MSEHGLGGMPGAMTISQGELIGRPSSLFVEVAADGASWTIDVSGGVRIVGDGAFEV